MMIHLTKPLIGMMALQAGVSEESIRKMAVADGGALLLEYSSFRELMKPKGEPRGVRLTKEQAVAAKPAPAQKAVEAVMAVPESEWPIWAEIMSFAKDKTDIGVGDTVRRMVGEENSEAFKKWYKRITGKDCGCDNRRKKWNAMYPYNRES